MNCKPVFFLSRTSTRLNAFDCNCACPESMLDDGWQYPLQQDLPGGCFDEVYTAAPSLLPVSIDQEHSLIFNPLMPGRLVMLNRPAHQALGHFRVPSSLTELNDADLRDAAQAMVKLGLLQPSRSSPTAALAQPIDLVAWLHLTQACNLRCAYCYQPHGSPSMSEATGRAALDAIFEAARSHGFRQVTLKYAGGEPTLRFSLVLRLHSYAQSLASRHGLALRATLLTNGLLLNDAMLEATRKAGIHLMISLDGPTAHDIQRPQANGQGSFTQAAEAVDRAIRHGIFPHISITVTRLNAGMLGEAAAFALDRNLTFSLNLYRENDQASTKKLSASAEELLTGVRAALQVIEERMPQERLIDGMFDLVSFAAGHNRPCGAGFNYLAITPNGKIARCQMEIEHSVGDVFHDDPCEIIQQAGAGCHLTVDQRQGCRECTWRYACAGGCPLQAERAYGRFDQPSPNCAVYKALYPELLRLEGLRMLRCESAVDYQGNLA
jgi:uncharacterized protein